MSHLRPLSKTACSGAEKRIICLVFGPTFFSAANYIFLSRYASGLDIALVHS